MLTTRFNNDCKELKQELITFRIFKTCTQNPNSQNDELDSKLCQRDRTLSDISTSASSSVAPSRRTSISEIDLSLLKLQSENENLKDWQTGDFEVLEKISEGAQAEVYKCKSSSEKFYCLKVFKNKIAFEREVGVFTDLMKGAVMCENVMYCLGHAATKVEKSLNWFELDSVKFKNFDKINLDQAILFEYTHLGSLEQYIKHNKLKDYQMKEIIQQLTNALKFVHNQSYVHRDIKPQNVLVFPKDDNKIILKLIDFGLSEKIGCNKLEKQQNPYKKEKLEILSTDPWYNAPELFRGDTMFFDKTADMWSLGVTLFEFLTKCDFIQNDGLMEWQLDCVGFFEMKNSQSEEKKISKKKTKKQVSPTRFITSKMVPLNDDQKIPLPCKRVIRNLMSVDPGARDLDVAVGFLDDL